MRLIEAITHEIAKRHGVPFAAVRGPSRLRIHTRPRDEAMALTYQTGKYSTTMIGEYFSRDHTSVLLAINRHWGTPGRSLLNGARLTEPQRMEIAKLYGEGVLVKEIAARFNIATSYPSMLANKYGVARGRKPKQKVTWPK